MKSITLICFILLGSVSVLKSPRLPDQYRFSEDGRRLKRGGQAVKGLYDDKVIKRFGFHVDFRDWHWLLLNHETKSDLPVTLEFEQLFCLQDANGNEVDRVDIPALGDNQSYTREINGNGDFVIISPTFNQHNDLGEKTNKE